MSTFVRNFRATKQPQFYLHPPVIDRQTLSLWSGYVECHCILRRHAQPWSVPSGLTPPRSARHRTQIPHSPPSPLRPPRAAHASSSVSAEAHTPAPLLFPDDVASDLFSLSTTPLPVHFYPTVHTHRMPSPSLSSPLPTTGTISILNST